VPLYDAYQRELRKQNALDFDDLIMSIPRTATPCR